MRSRGADTATNTGATITVVWGYEPLGIYLTPRNWRRVKSGKPLTVRASGRGTH
jgi:hypothetical protein